MPRIRCVRPDTWNSHVVAASASIQSISPVFRNMISPEDLRSIRSLPSPSMCSIRRVEPVVDVVVALADHQLPRAVEGRGEPRVVVGLQKGSRDRIELEGLERVLVIGRDEDHYRRDIGPDALERLKPVAAHHLDVEEHEVRAKALYEVGRLDASRRLPDDLDAGVPLEEKADAVAGHGLVVGDECADS